MSAFQYSINDQEKIFSNFWNKFSAQILDNRGVADFPVGANMQPHHITTVIRLPKSLAVKLYEVTKDICPLDYHYPINDIHLTLINLDRLLGSRASINWALLGKHIESRLDALPALMLQVKGINVFPTTIFAQIYDEDGILELYREKIIEAVGEYLSEDTDLRKISALVPGIAFTNLIRFKSTPTPSIIRLVKPLREITIGSFNPSELELVTTNKLLDIDNTTTQSCIQLPLV